MRCKIPEVDLTQKLDGTVCRYKGLAVFVRVIGGGKLQLFDLRKSSGSQETYTIKPTDDNFDISSLDMGYMNELKNGGVLYITRLPLRRTKQGVDSRSIKITPLNVDTNDPRKYNYSGNNFFFSSDFADMVENKYPSLDNSLQYL